MISISTSDALVHIYRECNNHHFNNNSNILQKEQDDYTTAIRGNKGKGARIKDGQPYLIFMETKPLPIEYC